MLNISFQRFYHRKSLEMADVSDLSNVEINLDKVCRTCLSESDNMKSVFCFDDKIENMSLNLLVTSCTQLNMTRGDGLPERICIQCVEDVSSAFAFKLQAEKVDARLREYVSRKYPHLQLLHDNPIKVENDKLNENNDLDQKDDVKNGDFDCFSSQFETCNLEDSMNENRLYSCKFCDHYYHGEDQMTDHLVTVHEDKLPSPRKRGRPSRKDVSSRKAEILSLLNSMKVENEEGISDNTKNYNLNYADPTSILDSLSNKDIESSKDKEKKPHMCKLCDKAFVSSGQLKKHTASHKQRQTTPAPGSSAKRKPTPIAEDIELVKIKVESVDNNTEMFMEELGLQVNEKSPESPVNMGYDFDMGDDADNFDIDSDVDFTVGYTKKKSKKKTKHPHKCTMCGETFSRTSYIIRHMLTHNIQIPSSCDKCLQVFPSDELLANHLCMSKKVSQSKSKEFLGIRLIGSKSEHKKKGAVRKKREKKAIEKKEKTFKCSLCEKAFYSQGTLDRHGRTHLPKEKRFECPVCQKKFFRKDKMNMHAQIHNPNRAECTNFLCLYCGHSFKNSSNLIVHMRRHTGEKPYKCDICPKGFPRSTDLQTHRLTHTGEKPCVCKVCGKAFGRSSKLVRHMRIHTGQKPYKCMYCDRAFTQSNDLTLHVRRHTGEKPYVCGLCGDQFFNNTALQAHKRSQNHFEPPNLAPTEEKTSNF